MNFLTGITTLLIYQVIGEVAVLMLQIPIPGPVVGMLLLFLTLAFRKQAVDETLSHASTSLLSHFSLLFVPAGVGVMIYFNQIQNEWVPISVAVIGSTLLTLAITALSMKFLMRIFPSKKPEKPL